MSDVNTKNMLNTDIDAISAILRYTQVKPAKQTMKPYISPAVPPSVRPNSIKLPPCQSLSARVLSLQLGQGPHIPRKEVPGAYKGATKTED